MDVLAASPFERLATLARRPRLRVIGLMSGTSGDGLDIALVDLWPSDSRPWRAELLAFESHPYDDDLRIALTEPERCRLPELAGLGFRIGELAAERILELLRRLESTPDQVDLIGSHGHTLWHQPPGESTVASTWQVGEADVIAERTGVTTVSDFRARDVAAGGQGAPLVPVAEWLLRRPDRGVRLFLNLGGIANLSIVPPELEHVQAFDTGPGVALIDAAARWASGGTEAFDLDGRRARRGKADEELLASLLQDDYFARRPPKSTGRERFGAERFRQIVSRWKGEPDDLVATLTRWTTRAVGVAIDRFAPSPQGAEPAQLLVSGGGAHNPALMEALSRDVPIAEVVPIEDPVLTVDAKEAVAFAVLAARALHGAAGNVPSATGARRGVVLGKFSLGFPARPA